MQKLNTYKNQMSGEITQQKLKTYFNTNPGHLGGTLGTSRNYSRVVHLGWEVHLGNQMSVEIKMPKRSPTMQKLKTYKKYSTLSHQPGTPWGHTRDM